MLQCIFLSGCQVSTATSLSCSVETAQLIIDTCHVFTVANIGLLSIPIISMIRRVLPFLAHFSKSLYPPPHSHGHWQVLFPPPQSHGHWQVLFPPPQSHGRWRSYDASTQSYWLFLTLFPKSRVSSRHFKQVAAVAGDFKCLRSPRRAPRHVLVHWCDIHGGRLPWWSRRTIVRA